MSESLILLVPLIPIIIIGLLATLGSVKVIQPWERGILVVLGSFRRVLHPGMNYVFPLVSKVIRVDLRTQAEYFQTRNVMTLDGRRANVDAVIYFKVIDGRKAVFEVANHQLAVIGLADTILGHLVAETVLSDICRKKRKIGKAVRQQMEEAVDNWGVMVERVEVSKVEEAW